MASSVPSHALQGCDIHGTHACILCMAHELSPPPLRTPLMAAWVLSVRQCQPHTPLMASSVPSHALQGCDIHGTHACILCMAHELSPPPPRTPLMAAWVLSVRQCQPRTPLMASSVPSHAL